jgi:hypothetical protein
MYHAVQCRDEASERETRPVSRPSIQGQDLPPPLLLFREIFHHPPSPLIEGRAHDFSEIPL